MSALRSGFLVCLLGVLVSSPAAAQETGRIRFRRFGTREIMAEGSLVARTGHLLIVDTDGQRAEYQIDDGMVFERHASRGRPVLGGIIGGFIGMVAGAVVAPVEELPPCERLLCLWREPELADGAGWVVLGGMAGGAVAGAFLGSLFKRMKWVSFDPFDVPDGGPSVAILPYNAGAILSLRIPISTP